jgi:hypothetical protein
MKELERRNIANSGDAFQRMYDLYEAVRILKPMNYFLVTDQDPDKVLEIFVRVNSGGTKVETAWPQIKNALLRAAAPLQQFGYNERNLTAHSVIVPIAHYLHLRGAGDSYLDSTTDAADRLALQRWVTRSLIKRGIWGSGLDTTLTRIREALAANETTSFPVVDVEAAMSSVGKSLSFDAAEVDELLNLKYAGQRTFSVLSVLYPGLDLGKKFHEDHIFPKSRFTKKKLIGAGVDADRVNDYLDAFKLLPNLQLRQGQPISRNRMRCPATGLRRRSRPRKGVRLTLTRTTSMGFRSTLPTS